MIDRIKKTMLAGLGLAFLTKEKLEELSEDLVEKGKLSGKDRKEFMDELSEKAEDARKDVMGQIEKITRDTLQKMNIATRDDFLKLERQLKQLKKAVKEIKAKD